MTIKIHPTAIVDSNAIIGDGTEIGAYSIIGPKVILGANCWIGNHVNLTGNTTLGENCKISELKKTWLRNSFSIDTYQHTSKVQTVDLRVNPKPNSH